MTKRFLISAFAVAFFFIFLNGKTILFIGDSITDGNWGSPSKYPCSVEERNLYDKNHILGHGYAEMTAGYFTGEFPDSGFNFINRGISGETLGQISNRWQKDAVSFNPDVISLLCGTNDIHYWLESHPSSIKEFDFAKYRDTLDSLINVTVSQLPHCKVILCTPFVGKAGWAGADSHFHLREEGVDSIASITREIALKYSDKNVHLVDFRELKGTLEKENPDIEYWIWDGIHPTTAMHYRMSKLWRETLSPELLQ